ncbi:penicillin acylase family protein, partial [Aquicoccus sp.]|uniref:penicillin acylase family protein n=1 Tax=Aquicoccus sp. TaxID=2055851 RepID=UPI00356191FC
MARVFRWLMRITVAVLVLAVLAVGAVYYFAARSLPDYDKRLRVERLDTAVEIVRDHSNVPHVFSDDDAGVFFGLGYAHAQDRLWQMMVMRRTAQGRLSEVFGARTLDIDKLMRRLDLYRLARSSVAAQDADTLAALEAYADGVNARLDEINRDALGRGAPEMFLFDMPVSPWQPADSVAMIKLMAVQMMSQLDREVLRARLSLALPDEARLADILPDAPGSGVGALPEYAAIMPGAGDLRLADDTSARPDGPLSPFRGPGLANASNGWAAAPSRSATGGTLLANDPHLGFSAPSIWYLARLELGSGGVIGGTIPGVPLVLSGRGNRLGWGLTSSYLDDLDVMIEELNPDDSEEYRTPDGFKPFETRRSIIEIKDNAPVTMTLRWTENGPVLPASHAGLGTVTPPGHVASVAWTALDDQDTTMSAGIGLMRARSISEAIEAGEKYVAPSQNLIFADRLNVAMKTVGAMPRRDADHDSEGRMPALGAEPQNRWQGRLNYDANPEFIAPEGGIVGNTNNKLLERPFPLHVSHDWGDTQRVQRWTRLMQLRQVHSRDSFVEAQLDSVSVTARTLLPLVGKDLWFTGEAAPEGSTERRRKVALDLLADWNGEMNEYLPEPLIYMAWMRALQERLIRDELGPLADEFTHVEPLFIERVFRDVDGAAAWCDVIHSSRQETCSDIARMALDDALTWLAETQGTSLESLAWGDLHQATHDHPVLGEVPLLRYFVNIRQSTSGGDNTLNRA